MSLSLKQIVKRRGALVAAATAAGLAAFLITQKLLESVIGLIQYLQFAGAEPGLYELGGYGFAWMALLFTVLPLSVGYFLSLWLVAPIASELRLFHVIMRSVLATGIGATLAFVTLSIVTVIRAVSFDGGLFGNEFPTPMIEGDIPLGLFSTLTSSLTLLIAVLPAGILAAVIAWIWLAAHPTRHAVSGMLDEV